MSGVYNIAPLQVSIEDTPKDFAFPTSCISNGWLQKFFYPLRGNHKCEPSSMLFAIVLAIGHLRITYWWKQFDRYLAHLCDNVLCPPVTILYLTTEPSPPRLKKDLNFHFSLTPRLDMRPIWLAKSQVFPDQSSRGLRMALAWSVRWWGNFRVIQL